MAGFDIEGVGEDELDAGGLAGIGQPIPAEHAFAAHRQAVLVRLDEFEEEGKVVVSDVGVEELPALAIHDADVHLARVEIYSAVELCCGCIILHTCNTSWLMGAGRPLTVITRGVLVTLPARFRPMLSKNQQGFGESIKSRQPTPGGRLYCNWTPAARRGCALRY